MIVDERGRISRSIDAAGTLSGATTVAVDKPAGGTVRRAVLLAATTGFRGPLTGQVRLAGTPISLGQQTASSIGSANYWADVTNLVKPTLDAAPAGTTELSVAEDDPANVDGIVLAVVFNDPTQTRDRSVTLLFGATQTAGDRFQLQLSRPIDPNAPGSLLEMSLGISYSFQAGGVQQFSQVDVNGARLTTSAGGEDDGESANGGLITVGGIGDSAANPSPLATPSAPRDDDELYDLRPFVSAGATRVDVETLNPSNDDNIFFAAFTTDPPVTQVITPNPTDQQKMVALGDSYSSGEGTGNYDDTQAGRACHRGPAAWPRIVERRVAEIVSISHRACTGATTYDLNLRYRNAEPQIQRTPDPDVKLVTLTIGGNDVGFSKIVADCYNPLPRATCADDPDSAGFRTKLTMLGKSLDDLYRKLGRAYPNARIAHIGYPQITPSPDKEPVRCGWLSPAEQIAGVRLAQLLNGTIKAATERSSGVEYVDVTTVLRGRELCTGQSWMVPITPTLSSEPGHPTTAGQAAIAARVANQLGFSFLPEF